MHFWVFAARFSFDIAPFGSACARGRRVSAVVEAQRRGARGWRGGGGDAGARPRKVK